MMIDFALVAEREHGKSTSDSIFEACMLRFRPILMTTMAALFGALPLAFGTGTGSELRRPLGITIVGGLIVSQMLTLYTTPVVYLFFDRCAFVSRANPRPTCNPEPRRPLSNDCLWSVRYEEFDRAIPAGNSSLVVRALCRCPLGHAGWMQRRPKVRPPSMTAPPAFKESPTQFKETDGWTVAQPQDAALRGKWWNL